MALLDRICKCLFGSPEFDESREQQKHVIARLASHCQISTWPCPIRAKRKPSMIGTIGLRVMTHCRFSGTIERG